MEKSFYILCENFNGILKENTILRIQEYLENPNTDTCSDICSLIISTKPLKTIWQAIIEVDNTFPRHGRMCGVNNEIINEWERIPEPELVVKSIKNAIVNKLIYLN